MMAAGAREKTEMRDGMVACAYFLISFLGHGLNLS